VKINPDKENNMEAALPNRACPTGDRTHDFFESLEGHLEETVLRAAGDPVEFSMLLLLLRSGVPIARHAHGYHS